MTDTSTPDSTGADADADADGPDDGDSGTYGQDEYGRSYGSSTGDTDNGDGDGGGDTGDDDTDMTEREFDIDEEIDSRIEARLEAYDPPDSIDEQRVREIAAAEVKAQLKPIRAELDDLIQEVREAKDGVDDIISEPIGAELNPAAGTYHGAERWGLHIKTATPRRFGRATVDAAEAGTFTAVLARYDGKDRYEPYATREITVQEGSNEIRLEMDVPAGEWLLTRPSAFPLRRSEWDGWGPIDESGLALVGGSKPGDYTKPNAYYYYFYGLTQRAASGAHALLGPTTPPEITETTEYSTPGRGVHLTLDEPARFGEATLRANRPGTLYAELHKYEDGTSQGLVDSTELSVPTGEDIHEADLDLTADAAGEYLLCRDFAAAEDGFDVQADGVALARQADYAYFEHDSRPWLTVHGSGHPEFERTGDWYNFSQIHVYKEY